MVQDKTKRSWIGRLNQKGVVKFRTSNLNIFQSHECLLQSRAERFRCDRQTEIIIRPADIDSNDWVATCFVRSNNLDRLAFEYQAGDRIPAPLVGVIGRIGIGGVR